MSERGKTKHFQTADRKEERRGEEKGRWSEGETRHR